jgi:hypothetical protein
MPSASVGMVGAAHRGTLNPCVKDKVGRAALVVFDEWVVETQWRGPNRTRRRAEGDKARDAGATFRKKKIGERERGARAHHGCTHTRSQSKEELKSKAPRRQSTKSPQNPYDEKASEFDEGDTCTAGATRASRPTGGWWRVSEKRGTSIRGCAPTQGPKASRELDGTQRKQRGPR